MSCMHNKYHMQIIMHAKHVMHAPQFMHAHHACTTYQISDQISESDLNDHDHGMDDLEIGPKWAQKTLQLAGELVGDPTDPQCLDEATKLPQLEAIANSDLDFIGFRFQRRSCMHITHVQWIMHELQIMHEHHACKEYDSCTTCMHRRSFMHSKSCMQIVA